MNKDSNKYIIIYSVVMIVFVAVLLSVTATVLKDKQRANQENEMKHAILLSVGLGTEASSAKNKAHYIEEQYDKYIVERFAIDATGDVVGDADAFELLKRLKHEYANSDAERLLPIFKSRDDKGVEKYIIPLWGGGLWGPIWGYLALNDDLQSVFGVEFDHSSETPGLGAEISTSIFENQFKDKSIIKDGVVSYIEVLKGSGSSTGNVNAVDAISGGTITCRGVESMLKSNLAKYAPYINKQISAKRAPVEPILETEAPVDININNEGNE